MGISDDIRRNKKITPPKVEEKEKPLGPDEIRIRYARDRDEEETSSLKHERSQMEDDFFGDEPEHFISHHETNDTNENKPKGVAKQHGLNQMNQNISAKKGNPMTKWVILLVLILIALLAWQNWDKISSLIGLNNQNSAKEDANLEEYNSSVSGTDYTTGSTPTDTSGASTSPEATQSQTPTIDKSQITIQILNGNGITGSAASVKNTLVSAGFTVDSVLNAYKFTYQTSIIYYKTGQSAEADAIKQALPNRQLELINDDEIAGNYDIVVVVGKT